MAKVETHWYWVLHMFSNKEREYNKINYQEINGDKLILKEVCVVLLLPIIAMGSCLIFILLIYTNT